MAERSAGKDTATGHWEMTGLVTPHAVPGLPGRLPARRSSSPSSERIGRKVLGNKAASGTEILKELGEEHLRTGSPILYTSGDSVFQVAAHEELIPPDELYRICRIGYEIACLQYGVCRVIARPVRGHGPRPTSSARPTAATSRCRRAARRCSTGWPPPGWPVFGVGKIEDIFTGRGDLGRGAHEVRLATASTRR